MVDSIGESITLAGEIGHLFHWTVTKFSLNLLDFLQSTIATMLSCLSMIIYKDQSYTSERDLSTIPSLQTSDTKSQLVMLHANI